MPPATTDDRSLDVERLLDPSTEQYLFLYNSVGQDYCWVDRNFLPGDELRGIIRDPLVEVYRLKKAEVPAGFAELDRRNSGEIELAYFGLFPQFIGQGLGKYFLGWILEKAWSYQPSRVWVHTCDLDHPAALRTYLGAGFTIYDRKTIQQPLGPS